MGSGLVRARDGARRKIVVDLSGGEDRVEGLGTTEGGCEFGDDEGSVGGVELCIAGER